MIFLRNDAIVSPARHGIIRKSVAEIRHRVLESIREIARRGNAPGMSANSRAIASGDFR